MEEREGPGFVMWPKLCTKPSARLSQVVIKAQSGSLESLSVDRSECGFQWIADQREIT